MHLEENLTPTERTYIAVFYGILQFQRNHRTIDVTSVVELRQLRNVAISAWPTKGLRFTIPIYSIKMSLGVLSPHLNTPPNNQGILIGDKVYSEVFLAIDSSIIPDERFSSTPSMLDGLDHETETDLRILGCELIQSAGILLRLPQVTV